MINYKASKSGVRGSPGPRPLPPPRSTSVSSTFSISYSVGPKLLLVCEANYVKIRRS